MNSKREVLGPIGIYRYAKGKKELLVKLDVAGE
jgi:hypothetical protein